MTASLTPADARLEFQVCRDTTYLDVAARAPMADRVARELEEYLRVCRAEGARKDAWLERVEDIRARVARFIGAAPSEIAFMKNTSDGLNTLAHGLELAAGDNAIVCPELEHANNVYTWLHLRDRGVEVRVVPAENGEIPVGRVADCIDERTRVVALSSVSFVTGGRADLPALSGLCRPRGIFLLVDAVQELGVVRVDTRALGVDGMAAATQKGLLGLYGLGVLYCRAEWLERIRPPFLSRTAIDLGDAHESALGDIHDYRVKNTAARFETGNPNFAGLFALDAALSLLDDVAIDAVERHVVSLAARLMDGLDERGRPVVTPKAPGRHAGIVVFRHHDPEGALRELERRRVKVSLRRGALRASLHVYNNGKDVDHLLEALPS